MTTSNLLAKRQKLLGSAPLFYQQPIEIVRGEGVYLFDRAGKQYIDMYNNVPCVGHANRYVADAVRQQMGVLNIHSRYLNEGILDYADRLLSKHSADFDQVVFACTGTEASEIALMMARLATNGKGIICTDAAYHGNSSEVIKMAHRPVTDPYYRSIPFPQSYREPVGRSHDESLTEFYLACVQEAIEDFSDQQIPFAGIMLCSILANEGLPNIPAGFLAQVVKLVHEAGGLVIADEVQAGYCRSGCWWGYEYSGFTPDIVTTGKPMGNGVPIAAVFAKQELVTAFRKTRYFNTYAASPLQAAAGMAVLDEIDSKNLLANVADVGEYLLCELKSIQTNYDQMGDVRGCGLFIGIEWVVDKDSQAADRKTAISTVTQIKERGFLLSNAGAAGNVLKIRPPLVFNKQHADLFLTVFQEVLDAL